ncbi:uncharacterized protein C10orf67 homolog, mitochondrial [Pseudonaja textilis]|uniref:uncharacterized protein C10orf67 homolog, mitochondrial n=1 Tax=Pseudonaja textilis TaxID=8673 RepID=UPI000EA9700F|nr:uncharacterized protein C10orf67 homolog, mitochondrial [Pseudonaja textilis]
MRRTSKNSLGHPRPTRRRRRPETASALSSVPHAGGEAGPQKQRPLPSPSRFPRTAPKREFLLRHSSGRLLPPFRRPRPSWKVLEAQQRGSGQGRPGLVYFPPFSTLRDTRRQAGWPRTLAAKTHTSARARARGYTCFVVSGRLRRGGEGTTRITRFKRPRDSLLTPRGSCSKSKERRKEERPPVGNSQARRVRPRISEDLKIGFLISDHATQTEISEVGDLKQSTAMTRTLLEFAYSLCDDFAMYKNILKIQYEEKIQEYSSKLWLEITDRLEDIDKLYKQKEMKTRYSYQQQLSDALAILKMNYSKYAQVDEQCKVDLSAAKIDKLRRIIDEQADKIEYLTALLEEEKDMRDEKLQREGYVDVEWHRQQMRELREQIISLTEKNTELQEIVKLGVKEQTNLENEMKLLQSKMEKDTKTMEKFTNAYDLLKAELERERERVQAKIQELKEAQDALSKLKETGAQPIAKKASDLEEKMKKGRKKSLKGKTSKETASKEPALKPATTKGAALEDAALKEAATKEAATKGDGTSEILDEAAERKALYNEIKRLKKAEEQARLYVERLQKELRDLNQSWELKFDILKRSLHAIKNEMYLRQSLQQSVKFRRPLLNERKALPIHIQNRVQNPPHKRRWISSSLYMQYSPLPEITAEIDIEPSEEDQNDANNPVTTAIPNALTQDEERLELSRLPSSPLVSPEH